MSTTAGADDKAAAARANGAKFFAGLVTFGTATMAAPAAPAKKAAKRSKKKKM